MTRQSSLLRGFILLLAGVVLSSFTASAHTASSLRGPNAASTEDEFLFLPILGRNAILGTIEVEAFGTIRSATEDNEIIVDATICDVGSNECVNSDEDGFYILPSYSGSRMLRIQADGYYQATRIVVLSNQQDTEVNFWLSPDNISSPDYFRVVLSWSNPIDGQIKPDLDSNLFLPSSDYYRVHFVQNNLCPLINGQGNIAEFPYALVYKDVRGDENAEYLDFDVDPTNTRAPSGIYTFAVEHYDYSSGIYDRPNLQESLANVAVYGQSGQIASWDVPSSGGALDKWWKVFTYDTATRIFTPVNTIMQELTIDSGSIPPCVP